MVALGTNHYFYGGGDEKFSSANNFFNKCASAIFFVLFFFTVLSPMVLKIFKLKLFFEEKSIMLLAIILATYAPSNL